MKKETEIEDELLLLEDLVKSTDEMLDRLFSHKEILLKENPGSNNWGMYEMLQKQKVKWQAMLEILNWVLNG